MVIMVIMVIEDIYIIDHQVIYGLIHGIGLGDYVEMVAQIYREENGVVNIREEDQMTVGLQVIVLVVEIKKILFI